MSKPPAPDAPKQEPHRFAARPVSGGAGRPYLGLLPRLCVIGVALALLWLPTTTWGQGAGWKRLQQQGIKVEIRAATKIVFILKRNADGRPFLSGRLTDDRGKGVPGKALALRLPNGKTLPLKTGAKGRFRQATGAGWPRLGTYLVTFAGAEGYSPSRRRRQLDLRRVDMEIHAQFPPPLASGSHRFEIRVKLTYNDQPLRRFPLTLYLGKPQAQDQTEHPPDKELWPLMTIRSDNQGELRFVWEGRALEGPASLPLVLGYAGGRFFLPQRRLFRLIVLSPPHDGSGYWWWTAALISVLLLGGGFFGLQFLVQFLRNRQDALHHLPKAMARVELPPLADLGVGPSVKDDTLIAGWVLDSSDRSTIAHAYVVVERFTPLPRDQGPVTPALAASQAPPEAEAPSEPTDGASQEELATHEGDHAAAQDAPGESAASGAISSQPTGTRTDEHGRFILRFTEFGQVELKIYHAFYRAKRLTFRLPHQGEGRRLQLQITSYRELIFRLFAQAVERLVPDKAIDPQRSTAREIVAEISKDDAPKAKQLHPLASLFETSYYGPDMPEAERYTEAAERLSEISDAPKATSSPPGQTAPTRAKGRQEPPGGPSAAPRS